MSNNYTTLLPGLRLYFPKSFPGCYNIRSTWMVEPKGSIQANSWAWWIPKKNILGAISLGPSIQGQPGFWYPRKHFWWCGLESNGMKPWVFILDNCGCHAQELDWPVSMPEKFSSERERLVLEHANWDEDDVLTTIDIALVQDNTIMVFLHGSGGSGNTIIVNRLLPWYFFVICGVILNYSTLYLPGTDCSCCLQHAFNMPLSMFSNSMFFFFRTRECWNFGKQIQKSVFHHLGQDSNETQAHHWICGP